MENSDTREDWAFTIVIPPKKKVFWKNRRCYYSDLTNRQQYIFCEEIMTTIWKGAYTMKYVYEQHTEKRNDIHIHGIFKNEYHEVVRLFIHSFYSHYKIGINSFKKYNTHSDITLCHNVEGWEEYIKKAPLYHPLSRNTDSPEKDTSDKVRESPYLFGKLKKYLIEI